MGSLTEFQKAIIIGCLLGDGSKSYRALYLNTQKFSPVLQRRLIRLLKKQHRITAYLNKDKQYYRLRIAVASVAIFKNIVQPYILPIFRYKFPS